MAGKGGAPVLSGVKATCDGPFMPGGSENGGTIGAVGFGDRARERTRRAGGGVGRLRSGSWEVYPFTQEGLAVA